MSELPIDIVPGTRPPVFRWSQVVPTPGGDRLVQCEGSLPANIEGPVTALILACKASQAAADKLQAFKDWVHAYLDAQGVPKEFPSGLHTKGGCRIGDRMDWLMEQLNKELAVQAQSAPRPTPSRKGRG